MVSQRMQLKSKAGPSASTTVCILIGYFEEVLKVALGELKLIDR
jgi:hypothetical protein